MCSSDLAHDGLQFGGNIEPQGLQQLCLIELFRDVPYKGISNLGQIRSPRFRFYFIHLHQILWLPERLENAGCPRQLTRAGLYAIMQLIV